MKRVFKHLRRPTVLIALVLVFVFIVGSGTALATTYIRDVYIGLGVEPHWWGAAFLTASQPVSWLQVQTKGEETGWWLIVAWNLTKYVQDTPYCGQSGGGQYRNWGQPEFARLWSYGWYWWPGSGSDFKVTSLPHPYGYIP